MKAAYMAGPGEVMNLAFSQEGMILPDIPICIEYRDIQGIEYREDAVIHTRAWEILDDGEMWCKVSIMPA